MISYFLAANCYSLLFYGCYLLLLKGRSSHTWNRSYLLIMVLLVLVLPLVRFDFSDWYAGSVAQTLQAVTLPEVIRTASGDQARATGYSVVALLPLLYYSVTGILLLRFLYRMLSLHLFLRKQDFMIQDGYRLALNTGIGPASFGSHILFPATEVNPDILNHEKAHLKYRHHYDRLLLQLLRCFFFPVIPLYFIYKELVLVHEFEADALAAHDPGNYVQTLLRKHLDTGQYHLLQSFFHHPLKRRIMMLHRNLTGKSNRGAKVAALLCSLVLLGAIVYAQGMPTAKLPEQLLPARIWTMTGKEKLQPEEPGETVSETPVSRKNAAGTSHRQPAKTQLPEKNTVPQHAREEIEVMSAPHLVQQPAPQRHTEEKTFTSVEVMPRPPMSDLNRYLAEHIRYPDEAKRKGIQGRVVIQFVVAKDGSIRNAVLQRDIGGGCGQEALQVVNNMPQWVPGKQDGQPVSVYYTLPVSFRFNDDADRNPSSTVPDK